ncbi:uncharacterized protein LOC124157813 [Ischnura elegans]|uniref:uncharacterized protein LOC124157813 n=1 Tax=Ischnura elegans TaxID=197161 RepID=UPI001ED8B618|nr:uncharacterized protein LOC124157813 [Ischnura elegans]
MKLSSDNSSTEHPNANDDNPFNKLRNSFKTYGIAFLLDLARTFRKMDKTNENQISRKDFTATIEEKKLLTKAEAEEVLSDLDIDNTGFIVLDDLIKKLKVPIPRIRKNTIDAAISKVDIKKNGLIPLSYLEEIWDGTAQSYIGEDKTAEERKALYLDILKKDAAHEDFVTIEEFTNLHWIQSNLTEDDADFILTMRQAYDLEPEPFLTVAGSEYADDLGGPRRFSHVSQDSVSRLSRPRESMVNENQSISR